MNLWLLAAAGAGLIGFVLWAYGAGRRGGRDRVVAGTAKEQTSNASKANSIDDEVGIAAMDRARLQRLYNDSLADD